MDEADSARSEKLAWPIARLVQLRAFEAHARRRAFRGARRAWAASAMTIAGTLCMVTILVTVPRARDIR